MFQLFHADNCNDYLLVIPHPVVVHQKAIFDNLDIFQSWFGFSNIDNSKKQGTTAEEIMEDQKQSAIVTKLHEILRPFLLRRLKKDVLIDMPPKKEIVLYTPMSMLQVRLNLFLSFFFYYCFLFLCFFD